MSAVATAVDRLHGDEDFHEYSRGEEARIERRTQELTAEKLRDSAYWDGLLEGVNDVVVEFPSQLARCMANLDQACKGEQVGIDAVLTALSGIQRIAKADAMSIARAEAERELEAGEL